MCVHYIRRQTVWLALNNNNNIIVGLIIKVKHNYNTITIRFNAKLNITHCIGNNNKQLYFTCKYEVHVNYYGTVANQLCTTACV